MAKRPESDKLHLSCANMENKLDELSHVSGSRLLVATRKVRLAKSKDSAKMPNALYVNKTIFGRK